jgi:hypothetical protein
MHGRGSKRGKEPEQTVVEVGEQLGEQVLGDDADVGLDVVVEDEARREGRLVLAAPPGASPAGGARV